MLKDIISEILKKMISVLRFGRFFFETKNDAKDVVLALGLSIYGCSNFNERTQQMQRRPQGQLDKILYFKDCPINCFIIRSNFLIPPCTQLNSPAT